GGGVVGNEGLGQQRNDLRVAVPTVEVGVEVDGAADVAVVDGDVGVAGVSGVAAGHTDSQGPALDGVAGVDGTDGPSPAGAQARERGHGQPGPQRLSSIRCVHVPSSYCVSSGLLLAASRPCV